MLIKVFMLRIILSNNQNCPVSQWLYKEILREHFLNLWSSGQSASTAGDCISVSGAGVTPRSLKEIPGWPENSQPTTCRRQEYVRPTQGGKTNQGKLVGLETFWGFQSFEVFQSTMFKSLLVVLVLKRTGDWQPKVSISMLWSSSGGYWMLHKYRLVTSSWAWFNGERTQEQDKLGLLGEACRLGLETKLNQLVTSTGKEREPTRRLRV